MAKDKLEIEGGGDNELKLADNTLVTQRNFEIDFDRVNNIEDVVLILKAMNLHIHWFKDECPDQFKEIQKRGFLREVK